MQRHDQRIKERQDSESDESGPPGEESDAEVRQVVELQDYMTIDFLNEDLARNPSFDAM